MPVSRPPTVSPVGLWRDLLTHEDGSGWCGPIEWQLNEGPWRRGVWGPIGPSSETARFGVVKAGDMRPDPLVRLSLTLPEARAQFVSAAARGLRCVECSATAGRDSACKGSGYLRRPTDLRHLLADGLGTLPADLARFAPELLACSAERMARGLGPVAGVLRPWETCGLYDVRRGPWKFACIIGNRSNSDGWNLYVPPVRDFYGATPHLSGPEIGPEGRAAADRAALAAGFALVNADGIVCPWPAETPLPDPTGGNHGR